MALLFCLLLVASLLIAKLAILVLVERLLGVSVYSFFMLSLSVPSSITLACAPGYLQRSGPRGSFRRVTGPYRPRLLETSSGRRLFLAIDPALPRESHPPLSSQSARLSRLAAQREGLVRGYRRRLRLVGVGFRASKAENSATPSDPHILFKLGFSHDVKVPFSTFAEHNVVVTPSRLEGRAKGTLVSFEGNNLSQLNQCAASVRSLRYPDPYKGKGIQYDREVITLKKGKREG